MILNVLTVYMHLDGARRVEQCKRETNEFLQAFWSMAPNTFHSIIFSIPEDWVRFIAAG